MDDKLKKKLGEMVKEFKSEETTKDIRIKKNSKKIHADVQIMLNLKRKYSRLEKSNPEQFKKMAINRCQFLFTNFNNIFHRLLKNELNLDTLFKMIQVLEKIEKGEIDQHEGSYIIGEILKKLYIDSALKRDEKRDKNKKKKTMPIKKISWSDFKKTTTYQNNNLN